MKSTMLFIAFLSLSCIADAQSTNNDITGNVQEGKDKVEQSELNSKDNTTLNEACRQRTYKNSIILSSGNYFFPDIAAGNLLLPWHGMILGGYYERLISKHWSVKLGYNQWNTKWYSNSPLDHSFIYGPYNKELNVGDVTSCANYKMIDGYVSYRIFILPKHAINFSIGASYTWGDNDRIDSITIYPGHFDALISSSLVKMQFGGIVPAITYDYFLLKGWLAMGVDLRYRKYFGFYLKTFDYGIHLSLNF